MIKKGIVSSVDNINKKVRVTFPDIDNSLTYEIKISEHIGNLETGDIVLVAFWNENMIDGAVIAELR